MRTQILLWYFWSWIPLIMNILRIDVIFVSGQCLTDQRQLLFQLRNSLTFDSSVSPKVVQWNRSMDCCRWSGVTCDYDGHVIGLDLSSQSISGGIDNSSRLFSLRFLNSLNLAFNNFDSTQLPSEFGELTSLTYLNLSGSGFIGQIPSEFSQMTRLSTLDLSNSFHLLELKNPNLKLIVHNLTGLKELYLDAVYISAQEDDWCQALSYSLPNLRVLSMRDCYLSGPFDSSLARLQSLSVIRLDENPFFSSVPEFFANFSNLTVLSLSSCDLLGTFPQKILQVPTLDTLDLSNNRLLEGSLPEFRENSFLQYLELSYTVFGGGLPVSIGSLGMLSRIGIRACNFSGSIPTSISNLTQLVSLDFSSNHFVGSIPSFALSQNLSEINLYNNGLTGEIPSSNWEGLENLVFLDLSKNSLSGKIPTSLFFLPMLEVIYLSNNQFSGRILEFTKGTSNLLAVIDLSGNNLEGPIPKFLFQFQALTSLSLSSNHFDGTVDLKIFENITNLRHLDLSHNNLSVSASGNNSTFSSLPQFQSLMLASCKLHELPDLKNQSLMMMLDLSHNQIRGEIPSWIWEIGRGQLRFVNLSHNLFSRLQEPYVFHRHDFLDIHSNELQGDIPIPPRSSAYIDYSSNNFASSIPADIGKYLPSVYFFSISNNKLVGIIPESLCKPNRLEVLDLSNNRLHGMIPPCLLESYRTLRVLNLRGNNLTGNISQTFSNNCDLETLDLSWNHLEGQVPKSLANCRELKVLNLGNNKLNDAFPCWLKNTTNLRILVLRSNNFQGKITCLGASYGWSNLQIIDLASNNFNGNITFLGDVTGLKMELERIFSIFTVIDFSNNSFQGEIPETLGELKSLYGLNISHNALTGLIPSSVGNLKQLESLDLSVNRLSGKIPPQIADLFFLEFLNLSYNQLIGMIPKGQQFQNYTEASFMGNEGLCGFPLNKTCTRDS